MNTFELQLFFSLPESKACIYVYVVGGSLIGLTMDLQQAACQAWLQSLMEPGTSDHPIIIPKYRLLLKRHHTCIEVCLSLFCEDELYYADPGCFLKWKKKLLTHMRVIATPWLMKMLDLASFRYVKLVYQILHRPEASKICCNTRRRGTTSQVRRDLRAMADHLSHRPEAWLMAPVLWADQWKWAKACLARSGGISAWAVIPTLLPLFKLTRMVESRVNKSRSSQAYATRKRKTPRKTVVSQPRRWHLLRPMASLLYSR